MRGILRHGLTVEGLREFILGMGSSKTNVNMTWDKLWAINKKVIDPVAPRHTAIDTRGLVKATVEGAVVETKQAAAHPKNADVGTKTVSYGPNIFIEGTDAYTFSVGETVTLMEWGNVTVTAVERNKYTVCHLTTTKSSV